MHISPEATELLSIVRRGVKRIDKLISELMDSAQYVKMNFAVFPLQTVVDKTLEGATDRIILKKIKLRVSQPSLPALALVDLEKIKMALLNIILNAVEAMDAHKGVLDITIQSTLGANTITIKDNGSGMSKEVANRLFEPYFTSKPNGVGIGLATTHAIIESHKGSIDVLSSIGQGTTFTISFPALKQMKRERRSEDIATLSAISSH
jgi:signal transduction histidine kinase